MKTNKDIIIIIRHRHWWHVLTNYIYAKMFSKRKVDKTYFIGMHINFDKNMHYINTECVSSFEASQKGYEWKGPIISEMNEALSEKNDEHKTT